MRIYHIQIGSNKESNRVFDRQNNSKQYLTSRIPLSLDDKRLACMDKK